MNASTVIFDLDGTISDPSEGITNCINHALTAYGYTAVELRSVRPLIGPPLTDIFEALIGKLSDERMLALIERYRGRYAIEGYRENVVYADMRSLISSLHGAGRRLGVCTSKRADYAEKIVGMFGLGHFFDFVDGGDVHIRKCMQLERLVADGLEPASAIMIGDRAVDIEAARQNGIPSVGVCWGFGGQEELEGAKPDYLAATPADLLEFLS